VTPIYSILESPHRWWILAGIGLTAAFIGTIFMLAFRWPHSLAIIWFYLCLIAAIYCAICGILDWKARTEEALARARPRQDEPGTSEEV
jgi:hypothetical protein